jgi:hypothetical protein
MKKLKAWYIAQTDTVKALVVFGTTVAVTGIIFLFASWQINRQAGLAMEPYAVSQQFVDKYFDSLQRPVHLPEKYFQLFRSQQKIMSIRKNHYLGLSKLFFRNYYGVLIITMIYSCIGGVVLFLLINKGWSGSSLALKSLFLAIVMVLTFCGFFPTVFKQQENFNSNIKYYMDYTKAEVNIIDQLSRINNPVFPFKTDTVVVAGSLTPRRLFDSVFFFRHVDSMITVNNNTINNLTNYVLGIDAKEIKSMGEVYEMIYNSTKGRADSLKGK